MKKSVFGITAVLIIGAVTFSLAAFSDQKATDVYCSPDGTLSATKPIQSHRSYCFKSDAAGATFTSTAPNAYAFSIVDDQGNTLKNFAITHTKPMHVIVVRKDLAYFQHLHPEYDPQAGTFSLKDLSFPADGQYRLFADFAPENGMKDSAGLTLPVTISEDLLVGSGTYQPQPLGSEAKTKTFDGIAVSLATHDPLVSGAESMLMFSLSKDGKPVTDLEPYLGALGHSVILRERTLDFIHAHPMEVASQNGTVSFMVTFPEAGKYKAFTQFQRGGKVFTTDFVVSVLEGAAQAPTQGMDHSTH